MKKLLLAVVLFMASAAASAGFVRAKDFDVCPYVNLVYGIVSGDLLSEKFQQKASNDQKKTAREIATALIIDQGILVAACTKPVMYSEVAPLLGVKATYVKGDAFKSTDQVRASVVWLLKVAKNCPY